MTKTILILAVLSVCAEAFGAAVDAGPFGRRLGGEDSVGLEWAEMRRIERVEVDFAPGGAMPATGSMKVEYWQGAWDGAAIRRYAEQGAGGVGWARMDDWYNGTWKAADSRARGTGRTVSITFAPSQEKEFPGLKQRGPRYRATLKIRVRLPAGHPKVAALRAFTDSVWQQTELVVRFENRRSCNDPLEVHNGTLESQSAAVAEEGCALRAKVRFAFNPEDREADRTLVTVRSPRHPFTFAVDEAERGDRIYVKEFGVLVARASDPITVPEQRRILEESGAKSIYDRVAAEPEQTLQRAWEEMPLKRPYYFVLGTEGGRRRFRLHANGDIQVFWPSHPKIPGKGPNNAGLLWPDGLRLGFGLPQRRYQDQSLAEGYLPIATTRWVEGDLLYEEESFAGLTGEAMEAGKAIEADAPVAAFVKIRVINNSVEPRRANLRMSAQGRGRETLRVEGDRVVESHQGQDTLRYLIDVRGAGKLANQAGGAGYELELAPRAEHAIYLKIPFATPVEAREVEQLRALDHDRKREETARFWRRRVEAGSQIRTPERWLNEFYKAHLTHLLINDEREIGSERYAARVGSFSYGAYANESIMMISDLDRRGYSKEAERSLELFLHYQGTVGLPGKFATRKGVLYGAGGYEDGGYNQHHGWLLWGLGEHWWYTRDRAWMERSAARLVEACRWIASERKATERTDARGKRAPEFGLLPAGSLEDVTDYWFWVSTNCFTWWGMRNAAAALADFGHPEGRALVEEAERYGRDILTAYREAALRSPVVRLRDGTYVPHFPSNVYTRGRSYGWLRETLEGAIMLPVTGLLEASSPETLWIMKDYEDNLYISDKYGYSIPVFDRFWFSRGGFSMQPNLLHGPLPYFYRDEIKHFLRAYFNPFAAGYDPGLRLLPEHPLPELGYLAGEHFKPSDEAQSAYWLRLMFAAELGGKLWLGRGLPRYWLKDGETVGIRDAWTHFGKVSYEIHSESAKGRITMLLEAPERNAAREMVVRFRHPEGKAVRAVTVNGGIWRDFDPVKGDVRLGPTVKGRVEIRTDYGGVDQGEN